MIPPKGMVADHWTWRDGKPRVTGWHLPKKRGHAEAEDTKPSGRGAVRVTLFERMARVQRAEQPKKPKPVQEQLL